MSSSLTKTAPPHFAHLTSGRHEVRRRPAVPRVGAFARENLLDAIHRDGQRRDLVAFRASDRRNRHAPRALARDSPVGTRLGHVADSIARPCGIPLHVIDRVDHLAAQPVMIDADEPLLGREKNQRIVASPAMRIAVREFLRMQQRADGAQFLDDRIIRLEDVQPFPLATVAREYSAAVDRRERRQSVLLADNEILVAVSGRGMHEAGAGVGGDVLGVHQLHVARQKRMPKNILAVVRLDRLAVERDSFLDCEPGFLLDAVGQSRRHHVIMFADFQRDVVESFVQRDSEIRGQRPRRRRPDNRRQFAGFVRGSELGAVFGFRGQRAGIVKIRIERERDVDRRRNVIVILDFGLRQRRAAIEAPMHRTQAAIHVAVLDHLAQHADFRGVVLRRHREIRLEPVADTSEPPEIRALQVDPLLGFGAAQLAQLELGRRARLVAAEVARHLVLDRHPVTVPSGHERRAISEHRARAHDEVLQNFVERGAEMHAAVGIRRPVVQHPRLRIFARLHQARVEVEIVPMLEHLRLPLGQIRLHRKVGFGKFQGRFVIGLSHTFFQVLEYASDQINARGVASRVLSLNSLSLPPGSRGLFSSRSTGLTHSSNACCSATSIFRWCAITYEKTAGFSISVRGKAVLLRAK